MNLKNERNTFVLLEFNIQIWISPGKSGNFFRRKTFSYLCYFYCHISKLRIVRSFDDLFFGFSKLDKLNLLRRLNSSKSIHLVEWTLGEVQFKIDLYNLYNNFSLSRLYNFNLTALLCHSGLELLEFLLFYFKYKLLIIELQCFSYLSKQFSPSLDRMILIIFTDHSSICKVE